jgi:hypothetical protein
MNLVAINRDYLEKVNYVRKASPATNYWFSIYKEKLENYIETFGDDFLVIFYGDDHFEGDFYAIPFSAVEHIFQPKHLSHDTTSSARWVGNIKFNQLKISNYSGSLDLSDYFGNPEYLRLGITGQKSVYLKDRGGVEYKAAPKKNDSRENDYAIENKKIEIEARQKQSRFRKLVLKNFNHQCCISGITERELLIASHIVPWSSRIETRLDPANGLCLSILYDKLFDKGYMSFDEELRVIVTKYRNQLSQDLQEILAAIEGRPMRTPRKYSIKQEYLAYHREEIFEKKNEISKN